MKRYLALTIVAAGLVAVSCGKKKICTCTDYHEGPTTPKEVVATTDIDYKDLKKKDAQTACEDQSDPGETIFGEKYWRECKLP